MLSCSRAPPQVDMHKLCYYFSGDNDLFENYQAGLEFKFIIKLTFNS